MMRVSLRHAAALAPLLLGAGCAVGPDYHPPSAPAGAVLANPSAVKHSGTASAATPAQDISVTMDIPGQWWTLFHSPQLNALLDRALRANPDLAAAQDSLRQAREDVYAQVAGFFPTISANVSPTANKTATGSVQPVAITGSPYYSLNTAQLAISYNPDVFGLNRRMVEAAVASADTQRFQLEAVYLTLTSNLVNAAIIEAAIRGQIAATQKIIADEERLLDILRMQSKAGQVARLDELAQETALRQAEATLPPLQKQLQQQQDLITALSGGLPNNPAPEQFDLSSLQLPATLPNSLSSQLVEHRPDIRQAEANLHAASAQIGVAVANRLPLLNLTAFGGRQASYFSTLFQPGNGFWTVAASVTQPIFDGGALLHRERAARALFDQAASSYRSTVITAFQNVADSLYALQADEDAARTAERAENVASESLDITQKQVEAGQVAYLALLNAQQAAEQAQMTLVLAQAARLSDSVALFQALGGGWWNRNDVEVKDIHGDDVLAVLGLH